MKRTRKILAALAALLLLAVPLLLSHADSTGAVTGDYVNLRTGPSTSYGRVRYLFRGDEVTVTGTSGNWYAVTCGSASGYVYKSYVRLNETSSGAASGSAPNTSSALLRYGSRGDAVKTLQGNLILLGYLSGGADGIFGSQTLAAVRQYQLRNGLSVDGIAGSQTKSAVSREAKRINTVIESAKSYLGMDYLYGGSSPETGFDCSGLTQYCYSQAGLSIPRVSYEQAAAGVSVPKSQLRVGDLVAFNSPVSHVGIYLGGGKFIHSPKTGDVVKITSLSAMNLTAIRRFTGVLAK